MQNDNINFEKKFLTNGKRYGNIKAQKEHKKMKQEEKEMEIYRKMDMHITQEILNMINNRDMVKHLLWEAKTRSKVEECNIYVYCRPEWVNATVTPKYKGEENLFFKVEYNPLTN